MSTTKQEILANTLTKQIAQLEALLKTLESDPASAAQSFQRIRDVETQLHTLRTQLGGY